MARQRRSGKYASVWNQYGQKGFGIPTMAPNVGSYPLYPIGRARYALVLIASPSYDKKKGQRDQIAKRALAAHPSLKSFWAERKKTINARMSGRGSARMAANPNNPRATVYHIEPRPNIFNPVYRAEELGETLIEEGLATRVSAEVSEERAGKYRFKTVKMTVYGPRRGAGRRIERYINDVLGDVIGVYSMAANPSDRYGRLPARGQAEAAIRDAGFYDFEYDKKGTVPGLGPVLAYTAHDVSSAGANTSYRINVGRLKGTDQLEVRSIRMSEFRRISR